MKTAPCQSQPIIINVEMRSKDGLKGYHDNYAVQGHSIVTAIHARPLTGMPGVDNIFVPFETRTYRDTYRYCTDCGRRIYEEQ